MTIYVLFSKIQERGEVKKTHIVLENVDGWPLFNNMRIDVDDCSLAGFAECGTAHQSRRHLITKRVRNRVNDWIVRWLCRQANANVRSI